jgi:hypothetical protein
MKKIICALLITTSLLSFTACSGGYEAEDHTYVEGVAGKTFAELVDGGFEYVGYQRDAEKNYTITVVKNDEDELITNTVNKLEGKTIKDLYKNDLYVLPLEITDEECIFRTTIGTLSFNFEIDGSLDVLKKYNIEDNDFEVEEIKELHNKPISNFEYVETMYEVSFDDSFDITKFETENDFVLEVSEEKLKDCVVKEVYYNNIAENFV